jgi:tRNA A-37 threonylcarbamoyl transferase component Bud32
VTAELPQLEGKYEILEKLREGGMGAIYKVRHQFLDEVRVIKMMRAQIEDDAELGKRFVREARHAIRLRHPNIAQLYDFSVDENGARYMVIEYIDGLSLQEVLDRHASLPVGLTCELALQTLRALDYLHQRGLVHRDISPDNLMLTADFDGRPMVKLIDLGIAKRVGSKSTLTKADSFLGKVRYAAPESFQQGSDKANARCDLYSFGIVLYQLLTGQFPISGRDVSSYIVGHLYQPVLPFETSDPTGRVPARVRELVLRTLSKDPQQRPASAAELIERLQALGLHKAQEGLDAAKQILEWRRLDTAERAAAGAEAAAALRDVFPAQRATPPPPPQTLEVLLGDARVALEANDFAGARAKVEEALRRDPADAGARGLLAELDGEEARHHRARQIETELERARGLAEQGKLQEAVGLVEGLVQLEPRHEGVQALVRALTAQQAVLRARYLREEAVRLRDRGDIESASRLLDEAVQLLPGDASLTDMQRRYAAELGLRRAHEERSRWLDDCVQRVRGLFDQRSWEEARDALISAQGTVGECEELYALWDEFAQREQQDRDAQFAAALERARTLGEEGRREEAIPLLEEALALGASEPGPAELLLAELREALEATERDRVVTAARQRLARELETRLRDGDLGGAQGAVGRAGLGTLDGDPYVAQQIERLRRLERQWADAERRLQAAYGHLEEERFEEAAADLELAPRDDLPLDLEQRLKAAQDDVRLRAGERAAGAWRLGIEERLASGDAAEAVRMLEAAEDRFGAEPFLALRERVDAASQEQRYAKSREHLEAGRSALAEGRHEDAVRELGRARDLAPEDTDVLAAYQQAKTGVEETRRQAARHHALAVERESVETLRRQERYKQALREIDRIEREHQAPGELADLRERIESDRGERRWPIWVWVAGGAGLLALILVLVVLLSGGEEAPELPPPPPPSGLLVLDARPWAEVVALTDAGGGSVLDVGRTYTPLRLELPPGSYRMTLRGPDGRTVEVPFQVVSGRTVTRVEAFGEVDLAPLWERLGWGIEGERERNPP